jgi:Protein of unknown function DUF262
MAQEIIDILEEQEDVEDEAILDDAVPPERYDIASYGADYDVDGMVRRINRGDIFIPSFQRDYVWTIQEASRFVESLLLGLPVPGVFLAKEPESNKLLVIDGQQRLRTLQFFYNGFFNPKKEEKNQRVFGLTKVQANYEGLTYQLLEEKDRITLDNSIIHATVVKQEAPQDDDTSVYHIFERLNNGGRRLTPQEIRTALYHGTLIDLLKHLNEYPAWQRIYGKKSNRLKDQELILRFLALYQGHKTYQKPMEEFLNKFTLRYQYADSLFLAESERIFTNTVAIVEQTLGDKPFRVKRGLNAAVFDSVMVGLAHRLSLGPIENKQAIGKAYLGLLEDTDYIYATFQSTSDEKNVEARIDKAIQAFAAL